VEQCTNASSVFIFSNSIGDILSSTDLRDEHDDSLERNRHEMHGQPCFLYALRPDCRFFIGIPGFYPSSLSIGGIDRNRGDHDLQPVVYQPDCGNVFTRGKIISLINLNIGMQERLTMKDNIYLVSSLFGISREIIKKRFDLIVKFADLEEFVNTKLYQFSNGMLQRLAFSIAIHSNPKILLLDEVFAVGDEDFRKKSAERIQELVKGGASVILVSHELWMIEKYCGRVIWMKDGRIYREDGVGVLEEYRNESNKENFLK